MEEDALPADAAQSLGPDQAIAPAETTTEAATDALAVADEPVTTAAQVVANPSEPPTPAVNQALEPPAAVGEAVPSVPVGEPVAPALEPTIAPATEPVADTLAVADEPVATVTQAVANPSEPVAPALNQALEPPAAVGEAVPSVPVGEPVPPALEPTIAPATEPVADTLAVADDPVATVTQVAANPSVEPVTGATAPATESLGDPIAPVTEPATRAVAETTGSGAGAGSSAADSADSASALERAAQTPIDEGTAIANPTTGPSTPLFVEPPPTPYPATGGIDPAGPGSSLPLDSTVGSIAPTQPPIDSSGALAPPDEGFIASAIDALGSATQVFDFSNTSPMYAATVAALAAAGAAAARFGPSAVTAVQYSALPLHLRWRSPFSLPRCEPAAALVARSTTAGLVGTQGGVLGATASPPASETPKTEPGTAIPEAAGSAPAFVPPLAGDDLRSGSIAIALTAMAAVFLAVASLPARAYASGIRAVRTGSAELIAEYRLWAAALGFALLASAAFTLLSG